MIIEEEVYLEHVGVKGMKWGQRKDKSTFSGGNKTNRQKAVEAQRKKFVKRAAVGIGFVATGAVVAMVLSKRGNTKISSLPKISTPARTVSHERFVEDFMRRHNKSVREANNYLRRNDNLLNIPVPARSYLTGFPEAVSG